MDSIAFSLTDFKLYAYFFYFLVCIFFAFFIPGDLSIGKLQLPVGQRLILATIVGMVLWAWQGFIFGYLQLRYLTYAYLLLTALFWFAPKVKKATWLARAREFKVWKNFDFIAATIIVVGVFVQMVPVGGFGLQFDKGIFLCCANKSDLLFHLGLTRSIVNNMPPYEPGMYGVLVQNYHYWSNLVVAELTRVFALPVLHTQFQFIPLFVSVFLGLSAFVFGQIASISRLFTKWLLFFLYLGGDGILYLLLLLGKDPSKLASVSSLEDGSSFLINPPRAFSIVIAFAAFSFLLLWQKERKDRMAMLSAVLTGTLIGFKVYTGIFGLIGLTTILVYLLFNKKLKEASIMLFAYFLSAVIYFSTNAGSGGLIWVPFHLPINFIVQSSFGLINLELARQVYIDHHNYFRAFLQELFFTFVFLLSTMGTKAIGFLQSRHSFLRLDTLFTVFLWSGMLVSLFLGIFFIQQSGGSNTFNFIVSFWIFLSIPTALSLNYWGGEKLKNKNLLKYVFIILIVMLTTPRVIYNTYLNVKEYTKLDYPFVLNEEIAAMNYIKSSTSKDSMFVIDPVHEFDVDTPSVYAFIDRPMFLSGKGILESHGIPTEKRSKIKTEIFTNPNPFLVAKHIVDNKVDYIYLLKKDVVVATESAYFSKIVFKNSVVTLIKMDRDLATEYLATENE